MKKVLIILSVLLFSQIFIGCSEVESVQRIPEEKELVYDFYSFDYKHSEWMSYRADYFFSFMDTVNLILKEKTELKPSGVFLHFTDYKVNGVVIEKVGNSSKRSFSITIALVFFFFFFLIYGLFKETKDLKAGEEIKEINLKTGKLFLEVYSIFTLFFCFIVFVEGLRYGFVFMTPIVFAVAVVVAILSFSDLEKVKGSFKDLVLAYVLFFLTLTGVIYLYSETLFTLKISLIFIFDFVLLAFISAFFRAIIIRE